MSLKLFFCGKNTTTITKRTKKGNNSELCTLNCKLEHKKARSDFQREREREIPEN